MNSPHSPQEQDRDRQVILNVGCGKVVDHRLLSAFPPANWRELRLDIDPTADADFVASITDMAVVADASVDALWSSHNLEHLFPHEVPQALAEFLRVLKPGGVAIVAVPDLQTAAAAVAEDRIDQPLYESSLGPIQPLDLMYGYSRALAEGHLFMAHRTGFTARSLGLALQSAGFDPVFARRDTREFEIRSEAYRPMPPS